MDEPLSHGHKGLPSIPRHAIPLYLDPGNNDLPRSVFLSTLSWRSARRDVVPLNSAAAMVAAGHANRISDAVPLAAYAIDSGHAQQRLDTNRN